MPQTTGAMSFTTPAILFSSTSAAIWNDISGVANTVEVEGGERQVGRIFTADGDKPIITFGKSAEYRVRVRIVYTEATDEGYLQFKSLFDNNSPLRIEWAPAGLATGNLLYRTDTGRLTSPAFPQGEVGDGNPITVQFEMVTRNITHARMTTASGTY